MSEEEPTSIEKDFILMEIIQDTLERELNEEKGMKKPEETPSHIKQTSEEELKIENNNNKNSGMEKMPGKVETSVPTKIPSDLYVKFKETSVPPPTPAMSSFESEHLLKSVDRPVTSQSAKREVSYKRPPSARPPPPRNLLDEIVMEDDLEDYDFHNSLTLEQMQTFADPDNEKIGMAVEIFKDNEDEKDESLKENAKVEVEESETNIDTTSIDHFFDKRSGEKKNEGKYGALVDQILETQGDLEGVTTQLNLGKKIDEQTTQSLKKAAAFLQKYCQYSSNLGERYETFLKDCEEMKEVLRRLEKQNEALEAEIEDIESNFESELIPLEDELEMYKNKVLDAQDEVSQLEMEIFTQGEKINHVIVGLYKAGVYAVSEAKAEKAAKEAEEKLKNQGEDAKNNNAPVEDNQRLQFDESILELIANRNDLEEESIEVEIPQVPKVSKVRPTQPSVAKVKPSKIVPLRTRLPAAASVAKDIKTKKKIKSKIPVGSST